MHLKSFILFFISIVFLLTSNSIAFAEEKVTLSTYYPAPIAEYCDLEAEKSFTAGEEGTISDSFTNITPFYGDVFILPQNQDDVDGLEGGNVGIGTDVPETKLEVAGGIIKATGGLIIEARTDAPTSPVAGQLWLRTDITESIGGELLWAVTSNPFTGDDSAGEIISDTDYLYITGSHHLSSDDWQWRIEKRAKSNGSLIWAKTDNPSSDRDGVSSITFDADYLYLAGFDQSVAFMQWRIEKRSKSDGSLIWLAPMVYSYGIDSANSIISDTDYIYIAGNEHVDLSDWKWRIEKRFKSDGILIWARTNNPFSLNDSANSMTSDADYIYIAGNHRLALDDYQWCIEKRAKSDGSLIWTKTSDPTSSYDYASSITSDTDYLYIAGSEYISPGDSQWRIEKRTKSTGGLIWVETSDPSSGTDTVSSITSDADYLYITGYDNSPGNYQWRIEKRSKSDGSLIWEETSNPSSGIDRANSIISDTDYLYIAGSDESPGNGQWRIEKRVKAGGYIDIGLRAYDGTGIITIACEPEGAISSALRIGKDSKIYGVILVDPADPDASSIRIKASSGVKALRKF